MISRLDRPEAELKYRSLIKGALYDQPELYQWWIKQVPTPAAYRKLSVKKKNDLASYDLEHLSPMLSAIEAGQLIIKSPREYWGQAYSSQIVGPDLIDHFAGCEQEQVALICTDVHNAIIHFQILFAGATTECALYPDQILRIGIQNCASGMILAHNHPTGVPKPSEADKRFCQRIEAAGRLVGIPLLDFIIVGNTDYFSWRENESSLIVPNDDEVND